MGRLVGLLRGVNVGGKRKVAMPVLREALQEAGCTGVSTLLNSGNVLLDDSIGDEAATVALLERTLHDTFGFDVPVVVRTGNELAAVVAGDPFAGKRDEGSHHQVSFLAQRPAKGWDAGLDAAAHLPEEFLVTGRELHLWLPHGAGRSTLATLGWDKLLGTVATGRNWNTVVKLRDLTAD